MTPLEWEMAKLALSALVTFGVILAGCAYGLWKLGPEEGED